MVRLTKKVFSDLAIWMMGFGMLVGIIFPFFMVVLGMERAVAFTWWFFAVCITAGLFVGAVNIYLARIIVGSRILLLSKHMQTIESHLKSVAGKNERMDCTPDNCHIPVDSEDAIGRSSAAFNSLVTTLASSLQLEMEIRSFTRMLTSHLETNDLCKEALSSLLEMFSLPAGAILVESNGDLQLCSSSGLVESERIRENHLVLETLQGTKKRVVDIPEYVLVDSVCTNFRPSQVILQPILYKQLSLGVLLLAASHPLDDENLGNLELFSASLALALHNAMTHDQVQKLAAIDPLTGIYNRRFGLTRLHEEFIRSIKQNSAIGLLMMDIDRFKQVNDTYGHTVGDRILQSLASTARKQLREGDLIVRLGGDEFMVVLLGANKKDTLEVAESIRRAIEEKQIKYSDQVIKVTVSVGGASFPECDANSEEDLIEAADRSLYVVKESGRNRALV